MGVAVGLLVDLCNCNKAASVSTMDASCMVVNHERQPSRE